MESPPAPGYRLAGDLVHPRVTALTRRNAPYGLRVESRRSSVRQVRLLRMTLAGAIVALVVPAGAMAAKLSYTHPEPLPGSPAKGEAQGGEPSAVFDQGG